MASNHSFESSALKFMVSAAGCQCIKLHIGVVEMISDELQEYLACRQQNSGMSKLAD
jgi:hypothetical protein